ncbi:MAG: hypothetical protein BGP24_22745 [Lysobacterales bacterium 69-70]|nr:DUF2007 domain-containing protein [Xanthomonadaceae bacterium]ODU34210.1 MAG: hypothetical protein ABS97_08925 [Xanthomonadaceae bacterium SCN 69-320]ODV18531.1 MAG: hypothetical protein ABT27_13520 [Xanthomonadaceae bacterium SCN 69-25]OJY96118.1 MAG: hypothetical protein BGP24_22745 [Xanthomonadales bacterium 69-70]
MRIVYRAENIIDAHLVRNVLEAAGIPAHVGGEYLTGAIGELPVMGLVTVMVAENDVPAACRLAAEVDRELSERSAADFDLDGEPA